MAHSSIFRLNFSLPLFGKQELNFWMVSLEQVCKIFYSLVVIFLNFTKRFLLIYCVQHIRFIHKHNCMKQNNFFSLNLLFDLKPSRLIAIIKNKFNQANLYILGKRKREKIISNIFSIFFFGLLRDIYIVLYIYGLIWSIWSLFDLSYGLIDLSYRVSLYLKFCTNLEISHA